MTVNVGNEERYNANIILNYATEKLNTFANYSISHSGRTMLYTDSRIYRDSTGSEVISYFEEEGSSKNDALAHIINAGLEYDINDHDNLQVSGTYYSQNSLHKGVSDLSYDDPAHQSESRISSEETNDEFEHEGEGM